MKVQFPLIWKLFLIMLVPILATLLFFGVRTSTTTHDQLLAEIDQLLAKEAILLEAQFGGRIPAQIEPGFQAEIAALGKQTESRITVMAVDGNVLADSLKNPAEMENHADRVEVMQAKVGKTGRSVRFSFTLKQEMMYYARLIGTPEQPKAVMRVALPLTEVNEKLASINRNTAVSALFGLVIAMVIALLLARRMSSSIKGMATVANALQQGEYGRKVARIPKDEMGILARSLNKLSSDMQMRIEMIEEGRAKLAGVLGSMIEGVIAVDGEHRILFSNSAAYRLFGISPVTDQKPRLAQVFPIPEIPPIVNEVLEKRTAVEKEIPSYQQQKERFISCHATPIQEGKLNGVVLVFHNVTAQRQVERIRKEFVENASHELKTPLTAIKGYADTLADDQKIDAKTRSRFLQQLSKSAGRLAALTDDLLSLSRIESGKVELQMTDLDLAQVATEAVSRFRARAEGQGVQLAVAAPDEALLIHGDTNAFNEIMENLLDNAIKFTPKGGTITVRAAQATEGVSLAVEDTGIGIAPEDIDRIFERFYQVDRSRSNQITGTGLGLAIVKHLVAAHHGTINATSEPEKGSCFSMLFPRNGKN